MKTPASTIRASNQVDHPSTPSTLLCINRTMSFLKVHGHDIVRSDDVTTPVLLRGAGLGGWMNMENVSLVLPFDLAIFVC